MIAFWHEQLRNIIEQPLNLEHSHPRIVVQKINTFQYLYENHKDAAIDVLKLSFKQRKRLSVSST